MKISFLAAILILLISCTSSKMSSNQFNKASIPPEFKCSECILLIAKRDKGNTVNNYVEKSFKENYSGKFEMATQEEIQSNPKYQDRKIYRYILSDKTWTSGGNTMITTVTNGVASSNEFKYDYSYRMDFKIYDRLEDKNYPSIGASSNVPAKAVNRTSVLLNKILTE